MMPPAFWLCLFTGAGSFLGFCALFYFWLLRAHAFFYMDPQGRPGAFEPHAQRYQDFAKLLLTLSTATIAFMVHLLTTLPADGAGRNRYSGAVEAVSPVAFLSYASLSYLASRLS